LQISAPLLLLQQC